MTFPPRKPSKPFGLPSAPFDPRTGAYMPLGPGQFEEAEILEVGHDVLLCEDRDGRPRVVLKPWALRKTSFHGETFEVDGEDTTYASTAIDERTATTGTAPDEVEVTETVSPAYVVGEKIAVYKRSDEFLGIVSLAASELTDVTAGDYRLAWEDLNTAGRNWKPEAEGDFTGAAFAVIGGSGIATSQASAFIFPTNLYNYGMTVPSAGTVKVITPGWYTLSWQARFTIAPSNDAEFYWKLNGSTNIGDGFVLRNFDTVANRTLSLGGEVDAELAEDDELDTRFWSAGGGTIPFNKVAQWSIELKVAT